jgi:hypothetical protein
MDPLSITAATSSLVFSVVKNGRVIATLFEKFQEAQRCLFMIQTECTVLAAALSQLEVLFSRPPDSRPMQYPDHALEALDLSLVGCTLTFSVLSQEIDALAAGVDDSNAKMTKGKRVKYLWKEEPMNELLQQLRGQSSALTLLLKAFDSTSIDQILRIVQSGQQTFNQVKKGAASIRSAHPQEKYAESILDMAFDDTKTIYSITAPDAFETTLSVSSTTVEASLSQTSTQPLTNEMRLPYGWKAQYNSEYKAW